MDLDTQLKVQHGYWWRNKYKPQLFLTILHATSNIIPALTLRQETPATLWFCSKVTRGLVWWRGPQPEKEDRRRTWRTEVCPPALPTPSLPRHLLTFPISEQLLLLQQYFWIFLTNIPLQCTHLKANAATSSSKIASDLHHICKTNLQKGNVPCILQCIFRTILYQTNSLRKKGGGTFCLYNLFYPVYSIFYSCSTIFCRKKCSIIILNLQRSLKRPLPKPMFSHKFATLCNFPFSSKSLSSCIDYSNYSIVNSFHS